MENFYTLTMLFSIGTFEITSAITPGPNNIMLLSSGLTFGFKRTIPHIGGIIVGFPIMILLIGLGMGIIFEKYPIVLSVLKIVGILYLIWMAYKIATNISTYDVKEDEDSRPFTFLQAAIFQWVNPKAWIMGVTAISIFITAKEDNYGQILILAFIFLLSAIVSCNTWAIGGVFLKRFIKNTKSLKWFNRVMAILLLVSVIPIFFEG